MINEITIKLNDRQRHAVSEMKVAGFYGATDEEIVLRALDETIVNFVGPKMPEIIEDPNA